MKKSLFILFLLTISNLLLAQEHLYQVELNGQRVGSFKQTQEFNQSIHTFSSLDFKLLTLDNTLEFKSTSHVVESDSGLLQSVSWTQVFKDTLSYQINLKSDSISLLNFSDSSVLHVLKTDLVFGPEYIRKSSIKRLDTLGARFSYKTFSIELNQIIEVTRELISFSIENAQKLRIVKEIIGDKSTINKFNKDFTLIESKSTTPFGDIKLVKTLKTSPSQFFEADFLEKGHILSNVRFPDPLNINAVNVKIEGFDSLSSSAFIQHNQNITFQDSSSFILLIDNEKEPYHSSKTIWPVRSNFFWSTSKSKMILDSLGVDSLDPKEQIERIKLLASNCDYPYLAFYELSSAANFPSRIVYGYVYNQWFWSPKTWVEIAIDGFWNAIDLNNNTNNNIALKIAVFKSHSGQLLNHSYLSHIPTVKSLQIQSYTLGNKKHSVSSQILPYYFEYPVYENEGLGIRMNIPEGFNIIKDGIKKPSQCFLMLQNEYKEKIEFSQFILQQELTESDAIALITKQLKNPNASISTGKKLKLWYGFEGQQGVIIIPQGKSILKISIQHEDPEFTIFGLTRKNLHLKY